jgi:hypothetical protein
MERDAHHMRAEQVAAQERGDRQVSLERTNIHALAQPKEDDSRSASRPPASARQQAELKAMNMKELRGELLSQHLLLHCSC